MPAFYRRHEAALAPQSEQGWVENLSLTTERQPSSARSIFRGCVRRAIAAFAQFVHTVCSLDAREMQREDQELQPSPACSTMGDAYPSRAGISLSSHRIITGLRQLAGRKVQPCRAADP